MKKVIYIILLIITAVTSGCGAKNKNINIKNKEIYIIKCGEEYLYTERWRKIINFTPETPMNDGDCAKILADVTYLIGGCSGLDYEMEIKELKQFKVVNYNEVFSDEIPDYEDESFKEYDNLRKCNINNKYFFILKDDNRYVVYSDGEKFGVYDGDYMLKKRITDDLKIRN